jgi:hypothetical protein
MTEDLDYLPKPSTSWRGLGNMLRRLERSTGDRIPRGDVALANRDMQRLGCRTRYRADGTPFLLAAGERDPVEREPGNPS